MEQRKQNISQNFKALDNIPSLLPCPPEKACFFDIETTGLSARVSSLYLVGAAFFSEKKWQLIQWFADDYTSEEAILRAFSDFVSDFDLVVHYNGSTFDIPYLEKKYQACHLPSPFSGKNSLDLFRAVKQKKYFPAKDRKLATMERMLGFHRQDHYSGRDCIQLYTDFMQLKYFRDPSATEKKKQLLLHNHDDLLGTILCTGLLAYDHYKPSQPGFHSDEREVCLWDALPHPVPVSLSYEKDGIRFEYEDACIRIHVPLYEGTLYHFFPDYRNYYYLPDEDMAVHKSVGAYVDPAFREKATAQNCYIKKSGLFLPLPPKTDWESPVFSAGKRDRQHYIPWTEETTLTEDVLKLLMTGFLS